MITTAALALLLGAAHDISEVIPTRFQTAQFVARKVSGNQTELRKINKDFGMSYRFNSTDVKIKEPFMLRLESQVEDTSILFIINGTTKIARAPRSKISVKDDVAKEPGKRQTVLDFGLVTPPLMRDLLDDTFIRVDRETGAYVFDLKYKPNLKDGTRHRVWMDPQKKVVLKREWYSQIDGRLQATFAYAGFVQQDGIWFPTKYEVRNADNKLAGAINYAGLKINAPLSDSLFSVK